MNTIKIIFQITLLFTVILLVSLAGCQEDFTGKTYISTEQMQISDFLANREEMTSMTKLLKRSGYFNLLNSYGAYTVFAPDDNAWSKYLASMGKSSIDDLTDAQCRELFDFHVLFTSVNLKALKTGLLSASDTTMNGIQHFVDVSGGSSNIKINKTALVKSTLELPNGFVYPISEVVKPRPALIYDYLKTGGYAIFSQAVESVGLKDSLSLYNAHYYVNSRYVYTPIFTLFAESDEVLGKAGITTLDKLRNAVWEHSGRTAPTPDQALKDFVKYHIIRSISTVDKLLGSDMMTTFFPLMNMLDTRYLTNRMYLAQNISTLATGGSTVIAVSASNPVSPDPLLNGSVKLNMVKSDVSFKNGVVHELSGVLYPENKSEPQELTFECENTYRWNFKSLTYRKLVYADIGLDTLRTGFGYDANTSYSSTYYGAKNTGYALIVSGSTRGAWVDFYIRNLPVGKYNVYLNYRRVKTTTSQKVNVYFRKASEAYDWKTQLLLSGLDMSYDNADANDDRIGRYPEFNQNFLLGTICKEEKVVVDGTEETQKLPLDYGDYVFRFVHTDKRIGYYDNIILKPVN